MTSGLPQFREYDALSPGAMRIVAVHFPMGAVAVTRTGELHKVPSVAVPPVLKFALRRISTFTPAGTTESIVKPCSDNTAIAVESSLMRLSTVA